MFGYSRDELVGKEVEILVPERSRNVHGKLRTCYYANPNRRTIGVGRELSARGKNGVEFPVEISLSPTQIRGKALVWSAIRDISNRERSVAQLREAMQRMRLLL
jgi:PAS domain S-box-containing protein